MEYFCIWLCPTTFLCGLVVIWYAWFFRVSKCLNLLYLLLLWLFIVITFWFFYVFRHASSAVWSWLRNLRNIWLYLGFRRVMSSCLRSRGVIGIHYLTRYIMLWIVSDKVVDKIFPAFIRTWCLHSSLSWNYNALKLWMLTIILLLRYHISL